MKKPLIEASELIGSMAKVRGMYVHAAALDEATFVPAKNSTPLTEAIRAHDKLLLRRR